jgi:hypothetical protein
MPEWRWREGKAIPWLGGSFGKTKKFAQQELAFT